MHQSPIEERHGEKESNPSLPNIVPLYAISLGLRKIEEGYL